MDLAYLPLVGLLALTLISRQGRRSILARGREAWTLDLLSLANHFIFIPAIQVATVYKLYSFLVPSLKGALDVGWGTALAINMLIDYAWYWNHRAFHAQTPFWSLHAVHHAPKDLDVLASSRNSLWSPLFMVYLWLTPLAIFLAKDPLPVIALAGVSLFINFWGHTRFNLPRNSAFQRAISLAIIQPEDHYWHHSAENTYCNFGTVFNFWDKLHGTWHQPRRMPEKLGFDFQIPLWRKIFFPL